MRVIDASALVKYFAKESGWREVPRLIEEGVASIELIVEGVANALWKKVRLGEMEAEVALKLLEAIPRTVRIEPQAPLIPRAFEISLQYAITVYDAIYIALAESRGCELATCDEKQARAAERVGVAVLLL
ncbi:MAG: PIN domain nuclease [Thermoprotei archaeon]|nr:MAG: PIN domain nuclease [Thermoprotei archaeon]